MSGFQVQFGGDVHTPGDRVDVLVAMNPAALKTHLKDLDSGGVLIVNRDAFQAGGAGQGRLRLRPAARRLAAVARLFAVPITTLNREAAADRNVAARRRC